MTQKYCDCEKCKICCERLAGIPLPNEIIKIANFLKIPISKCLEKYFIVGWRDGIEINNKTYDSIKFVYPARKGWNNKVEDWGYPLGEPNNYCLFYINGLCQINEVKPFECLNSFGCNKSNHSYRNDALVEWDKMWKENKIHLEIKEFIEKVGGFTLPSATLKKGMELSLNPIPSQSSGT